jgi:hypothetical protein
MKLLRKEFIHDINWKVIYNIESKIYYFLNDVYKYSLIDRYEMYGLCAIKSRFKVNDDVYEMLLSKRNDDLGFSIYNVDSDKYYEYRNVSHDITIKNDKENIYNIYKIILKIIRI